jgi:hypothetical protein
MRKGIQLMKNEAGAYALSLAVLRDVNGLITQGVTIGDVTAQNQALILELESGELRENPAVGCGIAGLTNDNDIDEWTRKITKQIEADGQKIKELKITSTSFKLEAVYNE